MEVKGEGGNEREERDKRGERAMARQRFKAVREDGWIVDDG